MAKRSYHHGSLREAVLETARGIVASQGHEAVLMRDLAKQLGVTPTALYRHFANRSDLLLALAEEGHQMLLLRLERIVRDTEDPWAALELAMQAFLDFAQEHEGLFSMMYDNAVVQAPEAEAKLPTLARTYNIIVELYRRALPDLSYDQVRLRMISMWATLYGYTIVRAKSNIMSYMIGDLSYREIEDTVIKSALGQRQ